MRKSAIVLLVMVFFLSACATQNVTEMPPTSQPTQTPFPTQTETPTLIPPTSTPQPTPTAIPLRFDQSGYRNFTLLNDHFSGLDNYIGNQIYSTVTSAFTKDGSLFAIAGCWGSFWNNGSCRTPKSGFLIVINAKTGDLVCDIPLNDFWPGNIAFTPDGSQLLFSTNEYKIILWNIKTNTLAKTFLDIPKNSSIVRPDVAVAPDGSSLAAVVNKTLYVWRPDGELIFSIPAYQRSVSAGLAYSPDGSLLAIYAKDRKGILVYQASDGTLVHQFSVDGLSEITFSPDGQMLAGFSSQDYLYNVVVWNLQSEEKLAEFVPGNLAESIVFSPDGSLLLVTGSPNIKGQDDYSQIAEIYDTQTWAHIDDLRSFEQTGKIQFTQDGSEFFLVSDFNTSIWGEPDAPLLAGLDQLKQFQLALSEGDYEKAATFFKIVESEKGYLVDAGMDINDLPGSFERLCQSQAFFCYPVKELVMMGHDGRFLSYLVRLADSSGEPYTSPNGAQIIHMYLETDENGLPFLFALPKDY